MGCQHSKCQVRREERGSGRVRDRKGNFWNWIGRKRRAMVRILKSSDDDVSATTHVEQLTRDKQGRGKTNPLSTRRADDMRRAGRQAQKKVEKPEGLQQGTYRATKKSRCPPPTPSKIANTSTLDQRDRSVDSCSSQRDNPTQNKSSKPSITSAESSSDDIIPIIPEWRMRNRPVEEKVSDVMSEEEEAEEEEEDKEEEEEEVEEEENTLAHQEQGNEIARHSEEPIINRRGNDVTSWEEPVRDWIGGDGSWQDERQDQMEEEQEPANASMLRRAGPGQGSLAREQSGRQEELSNSRAIEKRMSRRESKISEKREMEKKTREKKKKVTLREILKDQVDKRQEEIRILKDNELKELMKDEKFAEAYRQKKQKEEEQKRREEYLRENGFVSEEIDDEDIRQFKYRAIQRQIAEKEERRKIQKQQRAEEEKRLEEEKKRKEEMKLERYFERLRLKRENEKQQLKQQREEKEKREKAQGILDEIETIAEMRKRETRARQEKMMQPKRLSDERRQRLSVIDEIDESNRERENSSNRCRSQLPSDSIDDLLQRKVKQNQTTSQPNQRSSVETREVTGIGNRVGELVTQSIGFSNFSNRYQSRFHASRFPAAITKSVRPLRVHANPTYGSRITGSDFSRHQALNGQNNRPQPSTVTNQREKPTRPKAAVGERPPVPSVGRIPESARLFFQRQHRH
ncbi:uncharacterized protein [Apostichopus japonicus]|uniref:uncharacterized protein isoform X2 n=1 Tax=Stichopus japonicus TaxID=307972 RepID=UPI003AB2B628